MTLCSGYCFESSVMVVCEVQVPPPELMQPPFAVVALVPAAILTCFAVVPFAVVTSV